MSRIICISIVILSLVAASVSATVVEIPLPGLLGTYPIDANNETRTVTFQLADPPSVVYGVSFRVSGTTQVGTLDCDGSIVDWPTMLAASMEDAPLLLWYAQGDMPYEAGAFAWTAPFEPSPAVGPTWSFLLDGTAAITLLGAPSGYVMTCTPVGSPPTLNVTEAVLIIDAEFPIPAEPSTWGRIKALYRN